MFSGRAGGDEAQGPVAVEARYRYNQSFLSTNAMVPASIAILLVFIPAILTALGVVRERELGSITNLYVTPTTRLEFLLGKQLPYIAIGMANFALMTAMALLVFGVPVKGSLLALSLGALLYVAATTGIGLVVSTFTRSQLAALFGTATGSYPVEAVAMMNRIIERVERDPAYRVFIESQHHDPEATPADAITAAARQVAEEKADASTGKKGNPSHKKNKKNRGRKKKGKDWDYDFYVILNVTRHYYS